MPGEPSNEKAGGVIGSSLITRKFQVTIPKKAREHFALKEGDLIMFVEENGRLYLAKGSDVDFRSQPSLIKMPTEPYYR